MHPVIHLLRTRKAGSSRPGSRNDAHKIGLVIEGGGMRGVVSAGMVAALESFGYSDAFDAIYGTSAGAINGAYFLARQAVYGTTIYYENISNRRFIDIRRILTRRPVMSLDFLIDRVMVHEKVLDAEFIRRSPAPLHVVLSSVREAKKVVVDSYERPDEVLAALRASSNIPFIAGKPVPFRGNLYLDGGLFESIPYRTALDDGCTHILALLTRPPQEYRGRDGFISRLLGARFLRRYNPALVSPFLGRAREYADSVAFLTDPARQSPDQRDRILAVQIGASDKQIKRLEIDRTKLVQGAKAGFLAMGQALGGEPFEVIEVLSPFSDVGREAED